MRSAALFTQNHLPKTDDLMPQNATPLRKSPPWSPNTSTPCVSCTAPATRNASFQILFKYPMPAIVFETATKPSCLLTFDKVHNPLRVPRKTTSERSKVLRTRQFFWASECASRHNGVHFFNISTSKSALNVLCFVHLDLEMCFAPQRRALFQHLNFQKCSEPVFNTFDFEMCFVLPRHALSRHRNFQKWPYPGVFCAFWLPDVLRATTACNFSFFIWPDGSAPAALANLLTFRPSGATSHRKNTVFATFLLFRAPGPSFFWDFFFVDLLSSFLLFFSSLTLPISAFHLSILSEVWLLNFLRLEPPIHKGFSIAMFEYWRAHHIFFRGVNIHF